MSLALTVTKTDALGKLIYVTGTIVASGNYVTGGDTLDLSDFKIKSNRVPLFVSIVGKAGYIYGFDYGTTIANGKMLTFENGAVNTPHAQIAAAAYPAGVTGDVIKIFAIFRK